jgi:predicted phosphohydrolase
MHHKIIAVSDLHGALPTIPPCDLLLIAGDVAPTMNHSLRFQADWLDTDFRFWLESLPAQKIVFIAGNHDLVFQQEPSLVRGTCPPSTSKIPGSNGGA